MCTPRPSAAADAHGRASSRRRCPRRAAALAAAVTAIVALVLAHVGTIRTRQAVGTKEIVFIDPRVPETDALVADVLVHTGSSRSVETFRLQPDRDGLEQITAVLASRHDVAALHVISHGGPGRLVLGSRELTLATMGVESGQLRRWRRALTRDADVLFYGCRFGEGPLGRASAR